VYKNKIKKSKSIQKEMADAGKQFYSQKKKALGGRATPDDGLSVLW
jgi:hypothetical protein